MNKIRLTISVILAISILVAGISLFRLGHSFKHSFEPKVDPVLYASIVAERIASSSRYKFLPKVVPHDAIKIAFFHNPGGLQASDIIALRVSLPRKEIEEMIAELESSGRSEVKSFESIGARKAYPEYGMRKPCSKNIFEGVSEIPRDFRIFLYECDIENIEKNWNHNILSFTAVSSERNEVVYYIEVW